MDCKIASHILFTLLKRHALYSSDFYFTTPSPRLQKHVVIAKQNLNPLQQFFVVRFCGIIEPARNKVTFVHHAIAVHIEGIEHFHLLKQVALFFCHHTPNGRELIARRRKRRRRRRRKTEILAAAALWRCCASKIRRAFSYLHDVYVGLARV